MHSQRLFCTTLSFALTLLGFFDTGRATAGFIAYEVTVDTSTLSGQSGYLDVQFNPGGLGALSATATVTNFSPAANLNPTDPNNSTFGDVSGSLASTLILDNGKADNELFEAFTYGKSITFDVALSGNAVNTPGGSFSSSFAFLLYDSTGTTTLLTTDPFGSVLTINANKNGTTSVETFPETSNPGSPYAASVVSLAGSVPAPPSIVLFVFAVPAGLVYWRRSRLPQTKGPSQQSSGLCR